MEIFLSLPVPPSINQAYGNNKKGSGKGRYLTDCVKVWKSEAFEALLKYRLVNLPKLAKVPKKARYAISYYFSFAKPGRRDLENYVKVLSDFLVHHGYLQDDSQIDDYRLVRMTCNPKDPHVQILIRVIQAASPNESQ